MVTINGAHVPLDERGGGSETAFELLEIDNLDIAGITDQVHQPSDGTGVAKTTVLFTVTGDVEVVVAAKTITTFANDQGGCSFEVGEVDNTDLFFLAANGLQAGAGSFDIAGQWWEMLAQAGTVPVAMTTDKDIVIKTIGLGGSTDVTGRCDFLCFWRPAVFGSGALVEAA